MDAKQCGKQVAKVKEIMLAKMPGHWKVEWRQAVTKMLKRIKVEEVDRDTLKRMQQSGNKWDKGVTSYRLLFRGAPSFSILFGSEMEFEILDVKVGYYLRDHLLFSRKVLNLQVLPLNLWYSLLFHVAYDNCKETDREHGHEIPRLHTRLDGTIEDMDKDNQVWLPAQHYLPALFAEGFAYILPDTWVPTAEGQCGYSLDGKVHWSNSWRLKLCGIISLIQCEQIVNHLFTTSATRLVEFADAAAVCRAFVKKSLYQINQATYYFTTYPFSQRHPIIWPSNNNGTTIKVEESNFDIYQYAFGDFSNPFATELKKLISQNEIQKIMEWIYTCFGENYDRINMQYCQSDSSSSSESSELSESSTTFPSAADDFSDPLNLRGVLSTTQAAKTLDHFRATNISVFNCLSALDQLSSRLPTALCKLTCEFLQFPSAILQH